MHIEDRPHSLAPPSAQSASTGMQRSRSHASYGSGFRSSANGPRSDFSRTTQSNWNTHSRQMTRVFFSSDSTIMTNMVPNRTSQDTLRYLANATAKKHSIFEKFLEQMKKYHTFQPSFVEDGVYSTLMASRRVSASNAWDTVGKILDASSSYAVRHNADGHFLATVENIPSVIKHISSKSYEAPANRPFSGDSLKLLSPLSIKDKDDAAFYLWRREHSNASPDEVREELQFRDKERAGEWRKFFASRKLQWKADLDVLSGNSRDDMSLQSTPAYPREKEQPELPTELLDEQLEQGLLWGVFFNGEIQAKHGTSAAVERAPTLATEIISDYRKSNELHEWMESKWRHHTHRHENAALRIQCAYRCHRARRVAARRRYARRVAFLEARRVEEESMRAWSTALRVMTDELNNTGDNFNSTWRSLNFVFSKLQAKAIARRARKKAEMDSDCEVKEYAATTIQRVYRGYCGRQLARIIRFPEVFEQLRRNRLQAAAIMLQATWRGCATRARIRRQTEAVLVIQRLVRLSAARSRLRHLRATRREEREQLTLQFAAKLVCHFLKGIIVCRRERILRFREQAELLQRVTSGLFARRIMHRLSQSLLRLALWTQRRFRSARGRELARQQRELSDALFQHLRRVDAATVIKRAWRRSVMAAAKAPRVDTAEKRNFKSTAITEHSMEEAVVMIQNWFRCMRILRLERAERDAAREELLLRESAERILCFYRRFKSLRSSPPPKTQQVDRTKLGNM
ncbi:hypothetical protein C3747_24g160 [Trypanosoma cruzi]|uniref:IQ calmodulin-binding protein n=2 Tax=Trypanosoma cruzi TaxID=5693 RepID=Q4DPS4_TRYCC|nr:hypothetical protein, conserved [Trypanosoma cruzi]EAN94529.1 hypothetical protein, conserved [Trypanosoma cruzi]PWV16340.1 hypothetical protein C3747_24g160 [Trypanosoma cruzi]RNC55116.1 hypothetical protein TcCL_ESM07410 [Trypanosoma cruzi]|eukprot:XP_816380.1 hypothetical protein [Trypanosoma cruzi strain CL Brener]